jgi:hypothetical protein
MSQNKTRKVLLWYSIDVNMSTEALLYREFIKIWGKTVTSVDMERAKAWDRYKRKHSWSTFYNKQ